MATPASMPQRRSQMGRETFQAFARASSRDELMAAMRSQAEAYFGGPVELKEASAQPGPQGRQASLPGHVAMARPVGRTIPADGCTWCGHPDRPDTPCPTTECPCQHTIPERTNPS